MDLNFIDNTHEFKRRFSDKFRQTLDENPFLNSFIYETSIVSNLFIIGGYLRAIANHEDPRDLDFIVNVNQKELDNLIVKCFQSYTRNRMGGYKVILDKITIDVWSIDDNWAFKKRLIKNIELNYVDKIAEGTFFNYDSLVIDLHSFQCNFKHYNACAKSKELDIIKRNSGYKRLNPTREANVLRAFYLMKKYGLSLSDQLTSYIIQNLNYSHNLSGSYTIKLIQTLSRYEKYQNLLSNVEIKEIVSSIYVNNAKKKGLHYNKDETNLFN